LEVGQAPGNYFLIEDNQSWILDSCLESSWFFLSCIFGHAIPKLCL